MMFKSSISLAIAWLSFFDWLTHGGCRLWKLANAEHTNCVAHKDIEAVRHRQSYVLVKEVTKEVRSNFVYSIVSKPLIWWN